MNVSVLMASNINLFEFSEGNNLTIVFFPFRNSSVQAVAAVRKVRMMNIFKSSFARSSEHFKVPRSFIAELALEFEDSVYYPKKKKKQGLQE